MTTCPCGGTGLRKVLCDNDCEFSGQGVHDHLVPCEECPKTAKVYADKVMDAYKSAEKPKCKTCGGSGAVQTGCPTEQQGCLVYHTKPCPSCSPSTTGQNEWKCGTCGDSESETGKSFQTPCPECGKEVGAPYKLPAVYFNCEKCGIRPIPDPSHAEKLAMLAAAASIRGGLIGNDDDCTSEELDKTSIAMARSLWGKLKD